MKNYLKTFAPFVAAIILGSLTFAFAQTKNDNPRRGGRDFNQPPMGFPPPPPPSGLHPRLLEQLNLTDAQKEQIGKLHEKSRTDSETYFQKARTADEQLKEIVEGGTFDEARAREIVTAKSQAMAELELIRLRTDAAIYNLLTAEQIARLGLLKQQRPEFPPRGGGFRPEERPQN